MVGGFICSHGRWFLSLRFFAGYKTIDSFIFTSEKRTEIVTGRERDNFLFHTSLFPLQNH